MEERRLDPPWHKLEEQCAGSKVDERNGTDTDEGGRGSYAKDANNISSARCTERTVKFAGTRPFSISSSLEFIRIHFISFLFSTRFENFPITCPLFNNFVSLAREWERMEGRTKREKEKGGAKGGGRRARNVGCGERGC